MQATITKRATEGRIQYSWGRRGEESNWDDERGTAHAGSCEAGKLAPLARRSQRFRSCGGVKGWLRGFNVADNCERPRQQRLKMIAGAAPRRPHIVGPLSLES